MLTFQAMARVLLLLPTSTYRARDFLEAAARLGVEVVVASEEPSTMERLHGERLLTLPFREPERAAERALQFHERHPLSGIVPVDEESAVAAASIAKLLGLPHNEPEAAERARLKHLMRRALDEGGVPGPSHRLVTATDDAETLAGELDYPAVLKPVFLSGSRGVVRVDDPGSFVERFRWLARFLASDEIAERGREHASLVLVEDFVPGEEVAVEAVLTEGRLRPLALFDKPDPLEGPTFEETIYVTPSRLPDAIQSDVLDVAGRAAEAIGLSHGAVHAELRLPPGGPPQAIEVAGRSIGGLCSRSLRFGVGLSLEELLLRHELGEDIAALDRESRASGVMMIPIPRGGELVSVSGVDEARRLASIEEVTLTVNAGGKLVPLPEGSSYLGFIFARAETPEAVESALRRAHRELDFEIE